LSGEHVEVDEAGLRRTWNAPRRAEGAAAPFRVFLFGGSTMWGAGARDEFTIASLLSKNLAEASGVAVEVTNFGQGAYVSTQELIALMLELQRGNVPDVAVFYDGANDMFASYQTGRAGLPQNEQWRRLDFELPEMAFIHRLSRRSSIIELIRRFAGPFFASTWTPPDAEALDSLARETIRRYAGNVRLGEALGAAYRFEVLYYWQPILTSKEPPLTEFEAAIMRSMARDLPSLEGFARSVYASVRDAPALAMDHRFRDLSRAFTARDAVFWDWCHITEAGNRRIADEIGRDVRALVATRAVGAARADADSGFR
jgi:lysophospholipase L1-like esterase